MSTKPLTIARPPLLDRMTSLEVANGEIEPLLDAYISEIEDEDVSISVCEQEMIERGCNELLEKALKAFEQIVELNSPASGSNNFEHIVAIKEDLMEQLKTHKSAALLEISEYLDERLTRLRRSFQAYRYGTITKLSGARNSITEYKKVYELNASACERDRLRNLIDTTESRHRAEVDELSTKYKLARSSLEMANKLNGEMDAEKVLLTEKCAKLENRALKADEMVVKVSKLVSSNRVYLFCTCT